MRSLEEARQQKRIGKALEAKLTLELPAEPLNDRAAVRVKPEGAVQCLPGRACVASGQVRRDFAPLTTDADGAKCTRCWNYRTDIGVDPRWATVCGRCAGALDEIGFPPLTEEVTV